MNMAYVRIVSISARARPTRSPMRPNSPPPKAQPARNAAWITDP